MSDISSYWLAAFKLRRIPFILIAPSFRKKAGETRAELLIAPPWAAVVPWRAGAPDDAETGSAKEAAAGVRPARPSTFLLPLLPSQPAFRQGEN